MSWLASIFIGILTGILGLFLTGLVASACVSWYRISSFEGKSGYFIIFTALFGGIVALVIGLVITRVVAAGASPGFFKGLGLSFGIVLVLAAIGAFACWRLADIPPKIDGLTLDLELEFRLPVSEARSPATSDGKWSLRLGSVINHTQRKSQDGELKLGEARLENGRWIIPGSAFLFTSRGLRSIGLDLDGKSVAGFIVPLPAKPGKKFEQWSDWGPRGVSKTGPWPDSKPSFRYRVTRRIPPPPPPDSATVESEQFAALKPDAPLEEWLPFMRNDPPDERVQAVMNVIEARPTELAHLIRSTNSTTRELALSAVPNMRTIPPETLEAILAEGRDIAAGVRNFNDMKAEAPDFHEVQIQLRSRFNYWKRAWWTAHQRLGLDGRPPVQEIHDLALVRAKESSMDEIVLNARVILDALNAAPAKSP